MRGLTKGLASAYHTKTVITSIIHSHFICKNNPKGIPDTLNVYVW